MKMEYKIQKGTVYLIGAGPGDLKLFTLKAKEILEQADVIIYDNLVNSDSLAWCKDTAKKIFAGKTSGQHSIPQSEINELLVKEAKSESSIVRLKGGDPLIFGRANEEINALEDSNIPYEIIPGITAAIACAAYAGIPISERDTSSSIIFLTGHENPEKNTLNLDFKNYAKTNATLCIYMGIGQMMRIIDELTQGGLDPKTPVAIVENGTQQNQRSCYGTLETIVAQSAEQSIKAPSIIFVGSVISLRGKSDWFESRPLFGKKIVVPRSRQQAGQLTQLLKFYGAEVLEIPFINILPKYDKATITDVFAEIASYEWIIFTSANGVHYFFDLFFKAFEDLRSIGLTRIAAVGNATAKEVKALNLKVDLIPESANANALGDALIANESLDNTKILLITGDKNSDTLYKRLEGEGRAIVDRLTLYKNNKPDLSKSKAFQGFKETGADAVLFTSSSTVNHYAEAIKSLDLTNVKNPVFGSIGALTSQTLKKQGMPIDFESPKANLEHFVVETIAHFKKSKPKSNS